MKIKHLIDEAQFDKYALAYEKAKTALEHAEANLAYQKTLYEKTVLYAPFDGVIFEKTVEVGDVVSGMMLRTIFKIQSKNDRKLVLEFDQKYWKKVKVGQTFKYKIDGDENEHEGIIQKYIRMQSKEQKAKCRSVCKRFCSRAFWRRLHRYRL